MEPLPRYDGWAEPDGPALVQRSERRKRERTTVHWFLRLFRNGEKNPVDTVTRNLSSGGFYCFSSVAFLPGESIRCILHLPSHSTINGRTLALQCRAHVLRVEAVEGEGNFGIACRIEDYHFNHP